MKRYASHYIFIATEGYLRQGVVEMDEGRIIRLFPLTEEIENTEWLSGAILICPETLEHTISGSEIFQEIRWYPLKLDNRRFEETDNLSAFHFSSFDLISMLPVSGTQRRRLR